MGHGFHLSRGQLSLADFGFFRIFPDSSGFFSAGSQFLLDKKVTLVATSQIAR
jgi:hypothetical protein